MKYHYIVVFKLQSSSPSQIAQLMPTSPNYSPFSPSVLPECPLDHGYPRPFFSRPAGPAELAPFPERPDPPNPSNVYNVTIIVLSAITEPAAATAVAQHRPHPLDSADCKFLAIAGAMVLGHALLITTTLIYLSC